MMYPNDNRDRVYAKPREFIDSFTFDRRVARVFEDMIGRSVPGYNTTIRMISVLASQYVQPESHCYDLGCSLGAASLAMQQGITVPGSSIIAVDNSPEMLQQARKHLPATGSSTPIELICADLRDLEIQNASMVVLNFTLQFIPPVQRLKLLQRIHQGLRPEGILVLSEKISFRDSKHEALQIEMHHAFKRANGYDDLEISQKRSALEKILIPETLEHHQSRLETVGFSRSDLWFQCFNFISLVARK